MIVTFIHFFFLMIRGPTRSTRTAPLFPFTSLVRTQARLGARLAGRQEAANGPRAGRIFRVPVEIAGQGLGRGLRLVDHRRARRQGRARSAEHTSELQSLMRISYAGFCLKKKTSN